MGLYRLKPASQRLVRPLEEFAVAHRVTPDALTLAAVPVSAVGGLALAAWGTFPAGLLAVPFLAAARLVLNLLDGLVARRTGVARPVGELWNELGDRSCDVLFLGGLALAPGVDARLGGAALVVALLASYAGITSRAAGARRQYGGIMSKPGRMFIVSAGAVVTWLTSDAAWLSVAAVVIAGGALITLVQRVRAAVAELDRAG